MGKPTESQILSLNLLGGVYNVYRNEVDSILNDKLPAVNTELKKSGVDEIKVITREEYDKS